MFLHCEESRQSPFPNILRSRTSLAYNNRMFFCDITMKTLHSVSIVKKSVLWRHQYLHIQKFMRSPLYRSTDTLSVNIQHKYDKAKLIMLPPPPQPPPPTTPPHTHACIVLQRKKENKRQKKRRKQNEQKVSTVQNLLAPCSSIEKEHNHQIKSKCYIEGLNNEKKRA